MLMSRLRAVPHPDRDERTGRAGRAPRRRESSAHERECSHWAVTGRLDLLFPIIREYRKQSRRFPSARGSRHLLFCISTSNTLYQNLHDLHTREGARLDEQQQAEPAPRARRRAKNRTRRGGREPQTSTRRCAATTLRHYVTCAQTKAPPLSSSRTSGAIYLSG